MIQTVTSLALAVFAGALAYRLTHVTPWTGDLLGPVFAYVAISGVVGALGVGALMDAIANRVRLIVSHYRAT